MKTTINLNTVRNAYPGLKVDELVALQELLLNDKKLEMIDGLELFADGLQRLDLSDNLIEIIENLEFLPCLKYLDLSNNQINHFQVNDIPISLELLNISRNPCCNNENLLKTIKEQRPNLKLICEKSPSSRPSSSSNSSSRPNSRSASTSRPSSSDSTNKRSSSKNINTNVEIFDVDTENSNLDSNNIDLGFDFKPLDADKLLQGVVERKVRLQNERKPLSMTDISAALDAEFNDVVVQQGQRRAKFDNEVSTDTSAFDTTTTNHSSSSSSSSVKSVYKNLDDRVEQLKKSLSTLRQKKSKSTTTGSSNDEFIARLRSKVQKAFEEKDKDTAEIRADAEKVLSRKAKAKDAGILEKKI